MANRGNPQILQVLGRQMAQVFSTDAILAECRLVLLQPQALQPSSDIHRRFPQAGDACGKELRCYIIYVQRKKRRWFLAILGSLQRWRRGDVRTSPRARRLADPAATSPWPCAMATCDT